MSDQEKIDEVVDEEGAPVGEKAIEEEQTVEEVQEKDAEEKEEKKDVPKPEVLETKDAEEEKVPDEVSQEIPVEEEEGIESEEEELTSLSKESLSSDDKRKAIQKRIIEEYATQESEQSILESEDGDRESAVSEGSVSFSRDAYVARYKELTAEKMQLTLKNNLLQRKLNEYFKKKRIVQLVDLEIGLEPQEIEKKYHDLLFLYEKERIENDIQENLIKEDVEKLKNVRQDREEAFLEEFMSFQALEKSVSLGLKYSSNGARLSTELVDRAISLQLRKMNETADIRYKYIKCKNMLSEAESKLEEIEKLDEGLQVKDFEKLQDDNEAYMRKLEDRDAELKKQRNICAHYHETIAHMKEGIDCENEKCAEAEEAHADVEVEYDKARENLGRAKSKLKKINDKLAQERTASGLLAHPKLHQDYKKTTKNISKLKEKQNELQEALRIHKEIVKKRSQANTASEHAEHRVRTKPRLHRSVNLGASCCRC